MKKGQRVRSKEIGWVGVVTMGGVTIVQVRLRFVTASGRERTMTSAWCVDDLEVVGQMPPGATPTLEDTDLSFLPNGGKGIDDRLRRRGL
jgi:hypothetical protein